MRRLLAVCLITPLALLACDDGDDAGSSQADMTPSTADMDPSTPDMAAPAMDMAVEADMSAPALDMGTIEADMAAPGSLCAGAALCFSNRDCPDAATVCLGDPGNAELSCCQPAERGVDPAGTPCGDDGELTCATAVCIEGDSSRYCSDVCDTEEDCPASMQRCFGLGIDGNVEGWCLPTD